LKKPNLPFTSSLFILQKPSDNIQHEDCGLMTDFRVGSLLLIMVGVFLSTMDSGMINVAIPTLMRSLQVDLADAEVILISYLLTITASLVLWGRLADNIGKRLLYLGGLFFFLLGSCCCYASPSFFFLLGSRFIQAIGAAMMMASGPAIIREISPVDSLGRNLGLVGIATACGLMIGPFVAGILLKHFFWNAIFFVEIIIAMLALATGIVIFRPFPMALPRNEGRGKIDGSGMLLWAMLVFYSVGLMHQFDKLLNVWGLVWLSVFFVLLFVFIRIERFADNPILPLTIVRKPYYLIGVVTAAVSFGILFTVLVLIPFYLEYVMRMSVDSVGLVMMAVPATVLFLSPLSGWLYDRIGARVLTTFGLLLSTVVMATLMWVDEGTAVSMVVVRLAAIGAGQAIFLSPNSASVLARVESNYIALTSGVLATARNLGMVMGATVAAAGFSLWFSHVSGGGKLSGFSGEMTGAFLQAFHATLGCAVILGAMGCVLSACRRV
jgi:MFS family permease